MKEKPTIIKRIDNAYGVNFRDWIFLLLAIIVISGIIGFIYEELFYRIDLGYWVKRGAEFGPWIDIYAWGGLLLTFTVWHFRKHPLVVFLLSAGICGVVEYITGYLMLTLAGVRTWDYNTEIWNWGNINGFVCARSLLVFGVAGLALVYLVIPITKKVYSQPHGTAWKRVALVLCLLFFLDVIVSYSMGGMKST